MRTKFWLIGIAIGFLALFSRAELPRDVYALKDIEKARAEAKEEGKAVAYLLMDSGST